MDNRDCNSSASSLGVMVLDDNVERAALLEKSLLDSGFRVVSLLTSSSGLLHQIEQHRPDVVLIDLESPDRDVLESLAIVSAHNPTPIVMFSEIDDADFIRDAVSAGVTAYQGHDLDPTIVKPIIDVAMSQFRSFDLLRQELAETRGQLEDHKLVERAKVVLARHRQISTDRAYQLMRKLSMDTNKPLTAIAQTVVATMADAEADNNG